MRVKVFTAMTSGVSVARRGKIGVSGNPNSE